MEGDNPCPPLLNEEDSLIQILLCLPVLSLLRFKSVCKSWRAIIENPFFIHSHATFLPPTTTNHQLGLGLGIPLFFRYAFLLGIGNIFTVSGDDEFEVLEDFGTPPPPYYNRGDIDFFSHFITLSDGGCGGVEEEEEELCPTPPLPHPFKNVTMVGCSNGIICLHNCGDCNDIFLWNPATKKCRFLIKPFPLEGNRGDDIFVEDVDDLVCYFVGFGFDVKTKDYKVFQITSFKPDKEDHDEEERVYRYARDLQVYSLTTDSWRRCKDTYTTTLSNLIMHGSYWNRGHYLNGTYLFMAGYLEEDRKCFKPVIMSFDFTEENFRTIQLPFDCMNKIGDHGEYIILFGEKIAVTNACILADHRSEDGSYFQCLDIWVLNEYGGNESSWSKFYTFTTTSDPKFIMDNGEFILLEGAKLQLLNLVTGEIKDLQCDSQGSFRNDGMFMSRVGIYKPSLVPIAAANGATDNNNLQVNLGVVA